MKGPCGHVAVNKSALTGKSVGHEAAEGAHQASLSQTATPSKHWLPPLRVKNTVTLSEQLTSAQHGYDRMTMSHKWSQSLVLPWSHLCYHSTDP